jgi:group I intron endonuclease
MSEKTYHVYIHTTPSGKRYIGITSMRPKKRWKRGSNYSCNPYFSRAIKKYGWENIDHAIVASGLTKAEAEAEEVRLIAQYKSDDRRYGYNIDHGGSARGRASQETRAKMSASHMGHPTSEETKRKISESHKGVPLSPDHLAGVRKSAAKRRGVPLPEEIRRKISAANKGRVKTPEECAKLSAAKMGHTLSAESRRKISETKKASPTTARGERNPKSKAVVCIETGMVYPTINDAKKATGGKNISNCCLGKRKTCAGFHWKYYEEATDCVDSRSEKENSETVA